MTRRMRFPIRLKFTLTFLVLVTLVLGAITFSTANLFVDDKKVYVNGFTSMVALGTAEEARTHLAGYRERLGSRVRLNAPEGAAKKPAAQMRLAQATIEAHQAELLLREVVADVMRKRYDAKPLDRARWSSST